MSTDALQYRIHNGDNAAFAELCRAVGARAYRTAYAALCDETAARAAMKQALLALRADILSAKGPVDVEERLCAHMDEAVGQAGAVKGKPAAAAAYPPEADVPPYVLENVLPEPVKEQAADEIRYDGRRYKSRARGYVFAAVLSVLFAVVFFWLLFGALMRGGAVPFTDLGYTWFNEHVLRWFHISI